MVGTPLGHAMEMDSSSLVSEFVVDFDFNRIPQISLDRRARELAIDTNDWSIFEAIWICANPRDVPVVTDSFGESARNQNERGKNSQHIDNERY